MDPETPSEPISDSEPKPSIEITDESANTNASPMNDNSESKRIPIAIIIHY